MTLLSWHNHGKNTAGMFGLSSQATGQMCNEIIYKTMKSRYFSP